MIASRIKKDLKESPIIFGSFLVSTLIISFALINFHDNFLKSFTVLLKLIGLDIFTHIVSVILFRSSYENIRKLFNENVLPLNLNQVDETAFMVRVLLHKSFHWCGWLGLILKLGGGDVTNTHLHEFLAVSLILPLTGYMAIKACHFKIIDIRTPASVKLKFFLSSMLTGVLLTSLGYYVG